MIFGHLAYAASLLVIALRVSSSARAHRGASIVVSGSAGFMWTFCLLLPAHLQEAGLLDSKLAKAGLLAPPSGSDIDALAAFWSLELIVIVAADVSAYFVLEMLRERHTGGTTSLNCDGKDVWRNAQGVSIALFAIGGLSYLFFPPPSLSERAEAGQGLGTVLRNVLISAIALLIYYRCFQKGMLWVLVVAGLFVLSSANVRSPLVVVFFAYGISAIKRGELRSKQRLCFLAVAAAALVLTASFMSGYRSNITRDIGFSTSDILSSTLSNPIVAPYEAGVDTLDGYRFSFAVLPREGAHPEELFNVFSGFVPRAFWPEKPQSLSVELSSDYLGYRASGQFLSPVGLLSLIGGNYVLGLVGLFLFFLLATVCLRLSWDSPWLIFVAVVIFRFELGGSSFDLYYGLTLTLPILLVRFGIKWLDLGDGLRRVPPASLKVGPGRANMAARRARRDMLQVSYGSGNLEESESRGRYT